MRRTQKSWNHGEILPERFLPTTGETILGTSGKIASDARYYAIRLTPSPDISVPTLIFSKMSWSSMATTGRRSSPPTFSKAKIPSSTTSSPAVRSPGPLRLFRLTRLTVGHPLIHLGYAFELSSRELAMEALGLATTSYNFLHKYLDDPSYTQPPKSSSTTSPLTILVRIHKDSRLNDLPANSSIASLFETHEALLMEYWNAWTLPNPTKQFEESQQAAVALLVATHPPVGHNSYDFFLVHLLTTSHAVRILLPLIPAKHHVTLVRQWFLLTIAVYISQHRLSIDLDNIHKYDTEGKGWEYAGREAREGKHSRDAHFVKAVRAMKVAEGTWGENDGFWCKAAVKFAREFGGWGFGVAVEGRERRGSAGAGL